MPAKKNRKKRSVNPGKKIKELRSKTGMGQAELARRAGLSQAAISHFEKGIHSPSPETVRKLTEVLGCSEEEIQGCPSIQDTLMQNCKRLSVSQCEALNQVVLQLIKKSVPVKRRKSR